MPAIIPNTNPNTVVFHPKPAPVQPPAPVRGPVLSAASVDVNKIREAVNIVETMRAQIGVVSQQLQVLTNGLDNLNRIIILELQ